MAATRRCGQPRRPRWRTAGCSGSRTQLGCGSGRAGAVQVVAEVEVACRCRPSSRRTSPRSRSAPSSRWPKTSSVTVPYSRAQQRMKIQLRPIGSPGNSQGSAPSARACSSPADQFARQLVGRRNGELVAVPDPLEDRAEERGERVTAGSRRAPCEPAVSRLAKMSSNSSGLRQRPRRNATAAVTSWAPGSSSSYLLTAAPHRVDDVVEDRVGDQHDAARRSRRRSGRAPVESSPSPGRPRAGRRVLVSRSSRAGDLDDLVVRRLALPLAPGQRPRRRRLARDRHRGAPQIQEM